MLKKCQLRYAQMQTSGIFPIISFPLSSEVAFEEVHYSDADSVRELSIFLLIVGLCWPGYGT